MLKVVLSDRHMEVEVIPVYHGATTSEFMSGQQAQAVRQTMRQVSRSLKSPLPINGRAHISLEKTLETFSNSAGEFFQPNSAEPFIDNPEN